MTALLSLHLGEQSCSLRRAQPQTHDLDYNGQLSYLSDTHSRKLY